MARRRTTTAAGLVLFVLVGCGTTVDEPAASVDPTQESSEAELTSGEGRELSEDDTSELETGATIDPDAPATAVAIEGSATDLLPQISIDMSGLSAEVAGDGDEDATIARIERTWEAIRSEVEAARPELVDGMQATIDMARPAVDANRPADADKAFALLTDLIDNFVGDA